MQYNIGTFTQIITEKLITIILLFIKQVKYCHIHLFCIYNFISIFKNTVQEKV